MKSPNRLTFLLAASGLLAACAGADLPVGNNGPTRPALVIGTAAIEVADFEEFEVCKHGSSATFDFSFHNNNTNTTTTGQVTLNDGDCQVIASAGGLGGSVTVTESSAQSGFQFDHAVVTTVTGANCQNPSYSSTTQTSATANGTMSGSLGDGICDGTLVQYYNVPVPRGGQGCTPGYWKQSQHFPSWTAPYAPSTLFSAVFEDAFPGQTLLQVLQNNGNVTGLDALGRHTVSALLNAASPNVSFNLTVSQVINAFNAVFPGTKPQYVTQKDIFAGFNEQTCPLN